WHSASISLTLTVRAAPLRECAARNVISSSADCAAASLARSSSSKPAAMASMCSRASGLNVASKRRSRLSSWGGTARALHLVLQGKLLELLSQLVQVARRSFSLPGAGHVLRAGLLDVLHRQRYLIGAHELLLAG